MKLFFCLLLLVSLGAAAQGSVKGKLMDTASRSPLGLATVTIFQARDTTLITYRLSNPEGEFRVPGLPLNTPLRAVISYSGYEAYRHEFSLTNDSPLDLGTIGMSSSSRSLDEVLVIAERPPITVKRDTIEFNASSFRTLPTSLVEDLLKKLPGVQVDGEGNITANGRKVNRILVDGKAFFGDDPKMATRNLPANVIDKIQVTEDKDEVARNTTGDLTQVGQVINLTLKKGVKKGWFGKAYAGGGTRDRYEAGVIANVYRDTMQLSVLGFSNNVNRSGFSMQEIQNLGGFNRSGSNSMMVMSRGSQTGFAINGISFGGLDAGLARTSGAGFNLNHAPNKRKSFFLQYFIGNTDNDVEQINNTQQFVGDTILNTRLTTNTDRRVWNHNFGAGARLRPDSLTDIDFRASYSYNTTQEQVDAGVRAENNKTGLLSRGLGNQFNRFYANRYNHSIFFTHRSPKKKGRQWNLNNFTNYNKSLTRYITESLNEYYVPVYRQLPFDQLRRQDVPYFSTNANISFAEPVNDKLTLRWNNRYEYSQEEQDISIFDKDLSTTKYELLDFLQSTGFERVQHKASTYAGFNYKIKKVTLGGGVTGMWQQIRNEFRKSTEPMTQRLFNILPSANFQWKQLSANYQVSVNAPQINYLNPVPDSTNPFLVRVGNPALRPAKQHSIYINNFNFFQGSGSSYNVWVNANFTDNDVVMSRRISSSGTVRDSAVNANGSIQLWSSIGFGKEFKNKQKFIFSFRVSPNFNFNQRRLIVNNTQSLARTFGWGPGINIGLNWNDVVEFRPMYQPNFSRTRYNAPGFRNVNVVQHYAEGELIVRWPKKLVWETNVVYRHTNQVAPGLPRTNVLWNAGVTLLLFKGDVGLLKFGVFDLLNRNNGLYRFVQGNIITDNQTNVLQRYGSLTFTYNIRNVGAPKKVGGRDRLFMF